MAAGVLSRRVCRLRAQDAAGAAGGGLCRTGNGIRRIRRLPVCCGLLGAGSRGHRPGIAPECAALAGRAGVPGAGSHAGGTGHAPRARAPGRIAPAGSRCCRRRRWRRRRAHRGRRTHADQGTVRHRTPGPRRRLAAGTGGRFGPCRGRAGDAEPVRPQCLVRGVRAVQQPRLATADAALALYGATDADARRPPAGPGAGRTR